MKHCNRELEIKSGKLNGKTMFYAECMTCGKKYKSEKKSDVENYFSQSEKTDAPATPENYELQPIPQRQNPEQIIKWGQSNLNALVKQSAQFIDKPATSRMIEKNIRYVANLSGKAWDKIWLTPEGQDSIKNALTEANYYAATLGDMGDLVPFGSGCEFIPNIECYKFALETGKNAPFKDIQIDLIHENDQTENYQKDGNFNIEIKRGIPRGDILAVVVSGVRTDNDKRIGEIYDVERLLDKARHHSQSYKSYLQEKSDFTKMKVEGKLKKDDSGRLYFEKKIEYTKNGKPESFMKKTYEDDIVNPYDGPDRPEMLRKAAGKSFFRPYMKIRNASAMAEEWEPDEPENREQAADNVLNRAADQFKGVDIQDAEIIEDDEPETVKPDEKNSNSLFNDN